MRALARLLIVLLFALAPAAPSRAAFAASDESVTIGALPAWVVRQEPDLAATAKEGEVHDGSYVLLSDVQRRIGATSETYVRRTRKVLTPTGVTAFAQLAIPLRPAYERVVVHSVKVRRGASSFDALRREAIKVTDNEHDADALMYHGTATARLILDDVRVGDVIDLEYSVVGVNPVFAGKSFGSFDLAYHYPVHHLHRRLITPRDRAIPHKLFGTTIEPVVTSEGETTVRTWDLRGVAPIVAEDGLPPSYDPTISVDWSELSTWKDVVAWALPMYSAAAPPDAELSTRIESIRTSATTPEQQVLAALKLVQSEIRYLGIELGTSSHNPAAASVVYKRRFGDCKDKTILLVTILRALGFEADPAFVNTSSRGEIARAIPSPLAFDHVITRARVGGRTYWLDGTISTENGDLDQRATPPFGKALVVSPQTTDLETIERTPPAEPLIAVEEHYTVTDYTSPVRLEVRSTYRGGEADDWRDRLASEPHADIARALLNFYAKRDLDIVEEAPPSFADDAKANTVTVTEHYRLPTFWKNAKRFFSPYAVEGPLKKPRVVKRTLPLAVDYPFKAEHVTRVTLPGPYKAARDARALLDATFKFKVDVSATDNIVTIRTTLETLRDTVPASETDEYLKMLDRIDESLGFGVDQRAEIAAAPTKEFPTGVIVVIVAVFVWGSFVVGRGAYFRIRRARRLSKLKPRGGEVPARAVVVGSEAQMNEHIEKLRCSCGARWSDLKGERLWSEATFEGRTLSAIRTSCSSCGEWTRCWFDRSSFAPETKNQQSR